jgi:ectoine hydroxylase-related dioxygenase (phytanoyl-CoA dioxygenase family)
MNSECRIENSESNGFGRLERDGFQIVNPLASDEECDHLAAELTRLFEDQIRSVKTRIGGVRNLLRTDPVVDAFAKSPAITELLREATGCDMFPVRSIFFDKTPEANWLVPWHQDLAIAVVGKIETPGFTGWSVKDGVTHVHPPLKILQNMVTLRLHLDDCDADNGALKVISNSHLQGKLDAAQIEEFLKNKKACLCEIPKGGALLMRPLLLHSSSPSRNPSHRRVLHIEFAGDELPNGLKWFKRQ